MEIYTFYQIALITASLFTADTLKVLIIAAAAGVALWIGMFLLQGFGLYAMAKKVGLKKRALAFVPFVNIWYIGKLTGDCNFFGQRMKRAGMYAMIAQIIATVLCILAIASNLFLWISEGAPQMEMQSGNYYWTGLTGFALTVAKFYDISSYLLPIFQLFFEIFIVVLMMGLCKKYAPKNYMALGILTLFVPISRFIIIFVLRNRQPIDYDAYMRARHEAYMRRQQQYYNQQNPYGNPYNNPYNNPYGNPYGNPQNAYGQNAGNAQKPDDPFGEFETEKGEENPFEDVSGKSDEFFK